ncbi:MAG: hypothetical protein D6689_00165 [Deltaproteobacteria bacterium]|nr:MAG: hypothetical protein D6689_00165 [Deltaproteobacteria bacterium]
MARHALGMRIAIPLDALRWFIANTPPSKKAPTDVTIAAYPPAIAIGATVELMGATLRASATIRVDELRIDEDTMRITLRLSDVDLQPLGESDSPVVGLIKSGALDLSKPGNLANFMPKKPPALVSAHDDEIVIDLMKVPKFSANPRLRRVLRTLTPVVNVAAIGTDDDMLVVGLRATPAGLPRALQAARTNGAY